MIKRPMCFISLTYALLVYIVISFLGGIDETEYYRDYKEVIVCGRITDKMYKNGSWCIHIKRTNTLSDAENPDKYKDVSGNLTKMIVYLKDTDINSLKMGSEVVVWGRYQNFSLPENEGQFNLRRYYRIRKYEANVKDAKVIKISRKYSGYKEGLFYLKQRTKNIYNRYLDEDEAGTLCAMMLGDKTGLNEDIKELYQAAGISHVLSLSGLHIASIGICVFSLLSATGMGIILSSAFSTFLMVSYSILTGMSTSTLRALIMFIMVIIARIIGRTYDLLSAASLSSVLILLENPYYVFDSGFLLSFLSVTGIGVLYPILSDILSKIQQIIKRYIRKGILRYVADSSVCEKIAQGLCISFATMLATFPVVMNSFFRVSRYSILINLIVVPLMSVILGVGAVSGIIGNLFYRGRLSHVVVGLMLYVEGKILKFYSYLCQKVAEVSGNTWVTGKPSKNGVIVYIILMSIAVLYYNSKSKKEDISSLHKVNRSIHVIKSYCEIKFIALIATGLFILTANGKPDYSINILSVGQGACNILYGKDIPTVVFDGGSTDVTEVGKYRIVPFLLSKGIDRIDYLFISHPDDDHVNGILELLDKEYSFIDVRHVFMSVSDERVSELAEDRNLDVTILKSGDSINNGNLYIKCLSPDTGEKTKDLNDMSLVLEVSYKNTFDVLFTGDISADIEGKILDKVTEVDLLQVPHHGSRFSSSEAFLKRVKPGIAVISSGKGNSYGHPHAETLERLEYASNARVLRTDESGQVSIIVGENVKVRQFKERNNDDK